MASARSADSKACCHSCICPSTSARHKYAGAYCASTVEACEHAPRASSVRLAASKVCPSRTHAAAYFGYTSTALRKWLSAVANFLLRKSPHPFLNSPLAFSGTCNSPALIVGAACTSVTVQIKQDSSRSAVATGGSVPTASAFAWLGAESCSGQPGPAPPELSWAGSDCASARTAKAQITGSLANRLATLTTRFSNFLRGTLETPIWKMPRATRTAHLLPRFSIWPSSRAIVHQCRMPECTSWRTLFTQSFTEGDPFNLDLANEWIDFVGDPIICQNN